MIKIYTVECIEDCSYNKKEFIKGDKYKAFYNNGYGVFQAEQAFSFCDMETCMYRHGHPHGFQKFFKVLDTGYVRNKKELKLFLHSEETCLPLNF